MPIDIEETLRRELGEVAESVRVPAVPRLTQEPSRARRRWQPLLVAAAVALIVAGAVAVVARMGGGPEPAPTPPSPSPSRTESVGQIPTTPPTVPYVLDQRLYVDGEQVPGTWWSVQAGEAGWLALRTDDTWWWGSGPNAQRLGGRLEGPPAISPNGRYVAETLVEDGEDLVTGFDTRPSGEGLGGVTVDLGDPADGSAVTIRAVTDDGRVIAQGMNTSLLWLPLVDNSTVDLSVTAPGQQFLGSTLAGLIVTDGAGGVVDGASGQPYLAEISDAGELTPLGDIPAHQALVVSPDGEWLAWAAPGSLGGEVTSIRSLQAQSVDGTESTTFTAPAGWGFRVQQWVWEDGDLLVSPVIASGGDRGDRMARCSALAGRCVLITAD